MSIPGCNGAAVPVIVHLVVLVLSVSSVSFAAMLLCICIHLVVVFFALKFEMQKGTSGRDASIT